MHWTLLSGVTTVSVNSNPEWLTIILSVIASLGVITAAMAAVAPTVFKNVREIAMLWQIVNSHDRALNGGLDERIDTRIAAAAMTGNQPAGQPTMEQLQEWWANTHPSGSGG